MCLASGLLMRQICQIAKVFLAVFLGAMPAFATHVAVLETIAASDVKERVSLSDRQYLTNILREQAVMELPVEQNYTIMTRENINAMLPPGKSIEDCEGSCLAETGRNIAADYVCQAHIGSFEGTLTLSAELYETAGNKLVASFNGQGASMKDLLDIIKEKSPNFFRKIKNSGGYTGFSGIGEIGEKSEFSYTAQKKYIVEIISTPKGAIPTVDGRAIPKCTSTPCKVQLEEGNHRIVVSLDRYDDAEMSVDIAQNDQKIEFAMLPNYGWLVLHPVIAGDTGYREKLDVAVDGKYVKKEDMKGRLLELDPGIHSVKMVHSCHDPMEFKVVIEKNKSVLFDKEMARGKGALELSAEYKGEPQAVAVYINGVEVGSTPFAGEVPLCAEVMLKGNGWTEKVDVTLKWHEVVQITHKLTHAPESVAMVEDATRTKANSSYSELNDKSDTQVGGTIPTNVEGEKGGGAVRWIVFGVSAIAGVTGTVLAIVGNNQAKEAANKGFYGKNGYEENRENAKKGQNLRGVGIGLGIAGAVGIGISFAF